jgi:superfamily II RNA helicase
MVKVCPLNYNKNLEDKYNEYFLNYNFSLHDFQKWALQGIIEKKHVLITAPTGSGKTLPAEFAISYFSSIGKKLIYTTPIKALSNEKFHNFTIKYPDISIGLITGDIKTNPDATILIMTTEILMNKLYQIKDNEKLDKNGSSLSFDMDIENELGCVVFDEIHMINDESRGHVWEQCIMLLPKFIQIIGLSATLDDPEKFAYWLENKGSLINNNKNSIEDIRDNEVLLNNDINNLKSKGGTKEEGISRTKVPTIKEVYLIKKEKRSVPLIHYGFLTSAKTLNKNIKDKKILSEIIPLLNNPILLQDEKNNFNMTNYYKIDKTLKIFDKYKINIKRKFVLNKLLEYLVEKEMLPALCYIFSRKQIEICAHEITTDLLEFDSKIPYIIEGECNHIIRKLPNYQEYLDLPEYLNLLDLLRKGIGIHHAGLMPILREMVEILFSKGYIKLLLCTETMSVGINLPVKTTIFTDLKKFNGEITRNLYSHEYTQAAGRAGRLGLDKIGYVFHLNNLFKNMDSINYSLIMNNKPQTLISKFKIGYNLILNLIDIGEKDIINFTKKSLISNKLDNYKYQLYQKMSIIENKINNLIEFKNRHLSTPYEIICNYINLLENKKYSSNKKSREIEKQIEYLVDNHKNLDNDKSNIIELHKYQEEYKSLDNELNNLDDYFNNEVNKVLDLLILKNFIYISEKTDILEKENKIEYNKDKEKIFKLNLNGKIAVNLREIHCLVFSQLYEDKLLTKLSVIELICFLSCFCEIRVIDDLKYIKYSKKIFDNDNLIDIINKTNELYNYYKNYELINNIDSGINYSIQYDIINYIYEWCNSDNVENCKLILMNMQNEKGIFLGEFIKALLKINNIANELEKISELLGNIEFLNKIKQISNYTLKFIATNQSLYV